MTSREEMAAKLLMHSFMQSVFKLTLQYLKVLDLMWHNNHIQITPSMFCSSYGWCPDVKSYLYSLSQLLTSAINQDVGNRTQLLLYESIELCKRQLGLMVQLALSFVNAYSSGEFYPKTSLYEITISLLHMRECKVNFSFWSQSNNTTLLLINGFSLLTSMKRDN